MTNQENGPSQFKLPCRAKMVPQCVLAMSKMAPRYEKGHDDKNINFLAENIERSQAKIPLHDNNQRCD